MTEDIIELIVNVIRAHLGESGIDVPKGIQNTGRLIEVRDKATLPDAARKALNVLADQLMDTKKKIEDLTVDVANAAASDEAARRLQTRVRTRSRFIART